MLKNVNLKLKKKGIKYRLKQTAVIGGAILILGGIVSPPASAETKQSIHQETDSTFSAGITTTQEEIDRLPSYVTAIDLENCMYVTDLSLLSISCPHISSVRLINCSSITDLTFLYDLKELKYVELNDIAGVTLELIDYFEKNGIEYDIEDRDIEASIKADEIISEIITDDMSEEEKIQAITCFVAENCGYRISKIFKSNSDPLSTTLIDKKGVCAGIAYTTNILLRKAGIESYELMSNLHAWNLIKKDGKYYYLDVTNLGSVIPKKIAVAIIKHFNIGFNYMSDPSRTAFTPMKQYESGSIKIPEELVEDIKRGESEKNLIEKYSSSIPIDIIGLAILLIGIKYGFKGLSTIKDNIKSRKK